MAIDAFLKLGDINGESRDSKYPKWIDVLAWSWGASQSGTMHLGGGGGSGKVNMQDLSVTKYVDSSTTNVLLKCCNGKHYPEAKLICRKAGEKPVEYLKITMTDVLVSSYSTGGSGSEDRITENLSLNFSKVKVEYTPQTQSGSGGGAMTMQWDIAKNEGG